MQIATARQPLPSRSLTQKSPRVCEGFAYEVTLAAQVRLLMGDQVGQASGDGEQHHEFAQERCHGATEPCKADGRSLSRHQGETRQRRSGRRCDGAHGDRDCLQGDEPDEHGNRGMVSLDLFHVRCCVHFNPSSFLARLNPCQASVYFTVWQRWKSVP